MPQDQIVLQRSYFVGLARKPHKQDRPILFIISYYHHIAKDRFMQIRTSFIDTQEMGLGIRTCANTIIVSLRTSHKFQRSSSKDRQSVTEPQKIKKVGSNYLFREARRVNGQTYLDTGHQSNIKMFKNENRKSSSRVLRVRCTHLMNRKCRLGIRKVMEVQVGSKESELTRLILGKTLSESFGTIESISEQLQWAMGRGVEGMEEILQALQE